MLDKIKQLRESTGLGMMACKAALEETKGDIDKAIEILRKKGAIKAAERKERTAGEGVIGMYLHSNNKIGAMVELNCETDFVARTSEFQALAHDIAMQITAMNPKYIKAEDVPEAEKDRAQEYCLMLQPFIKDPARTIESLVKDTVAKVGENIQVKRFSRFELGK